MTARVGQERGFYWFEKSFTSSLRDSAALGFVQEAARSGRHAEIPMPAVVAIESRHFRFAGLKGNANVELNVGCSMSNVE
jgi:hypothetical protein